MNGSRHGWPVVPRTAEEKQSQLSMLKRCKGPWGGSNCVVTLVALKEMLKMGRVPQLQVIAAFFAAPQRSSFTGILQQAILPFILSTPIFLGRPKDIQSQSVQAFAKHMKPAINYSGPLKVLDSINRSSLLSTVLYAYRCKSFQESTPTHSRPPTETQDCGAAGISSFTFFSLD